MKPKKVPPPHNDYITPASRTLILKAIKNGSKFGMHPYVWNKKNERMELTTNGWRLAAWYLNILIPIAQICFVTFRAVQTFRDEAASPRDTIMAMFGLAYYSFPVGFQLQYFFGGDEIPGLINQGLKLLNELNKTMPIKQQGSKQKHPTEVRYAEFFNNQLYYGCQNCFVLIMIFGFLFPGTRFLASSLHEDPKDLTNPFRLLSFMHLVIVQLNYLISPWLIGMGISTVPFPLCVTLDALRNRGPTPENIHIYRCHQLWVAKFNRVYSPFFLPIVEILLNALTTFGIVGVIRYPGVIGSALGNVGLTTYALLYLHLRFFATIDERSRTAIEAWKFEARGAAARQLRALEPISISVGSYFFIDRCLILTATDLIIGNSISILLVS